MNDRSGIAVVIGASHGIGLAMVRDLLTRPQVSRVYAASRQALLSDELNTLAGKQGERLQILSVDSTREADIVRLANEVRERDQRLHWLINCAGMLHDTSRNIRPEKRLEQVDTAQLEALSGLTLSPRSCSPSIFCHYSITTSPPVLPACLPGSAALLTISSAAGTAIGPARQRRISLFAHSPSKHGDVRQT